ncbi:MAG: hypothetical protein GXP39_08775 [Chloroflexi bacterium]|nr:hypothetical protein [Chloroflexota bacterium]
MRRVSRSPMVVGLLLTLLLSACQAYPLFVPPEPTPIPQTEVNKEIVRRHVEEYWNQGRLEVAKEIHAPDYTFHEQTNPPIRGRDAYDQFAIMYRTAFPDLHFTIEELIAKGDKVVERWSCTATHQGELMGIPPTGKRARTTGISIFRIADGKIAEEWTNWSALSLLQQLGVVPMPAAVLNQVHQGFEEALNAHDVDRMLSYFAEDAVYDYVPVPTPLPKKEIGKFFASVFQSFPDFSSLPGREFLVGNIRVLEHPVEGTHQAEWMGIPPTGKKFPTPHIDIFEYEGDKIKRLTTYIDISRILIQLGAMPEPELPELKPSFELPDPEPTGLSPLQADIEANARWNRHDLVAWSKMLHPDIDVFLAPLGPVDRAGVVAATELYFQGVPDDYGKVTRRIDLGNGWVLAEVVWTGTNTGPYFGVPPTGRPVNVRGGPTSTRMA